jgi:hypothetical protein
MDINDCRIFWSDGREVIATPNKCIGMERSSVWDHQGIVQRIEDFIQGIKKTYVELNKVILSETDPRYSPENPSLVRWSFNEQRFYKLSSIP